MSEIQRKESDIQKGILQYLSLHPRVVAWRQNVGAVKIGKHYVRFGMKGAADITGILETGRRIEIEVKGSGGKQSKEQKSFQEMIERCRGVYILAYDLSDVQTVLAWKCTWNR